MLVRMNNGDIREYNEAYALNLIRGGMATAATEEAPTKEDSDVTTDETE